MMKKILIAILLLATVSVTWAQVDSIDVSAIAKDDTAALTVPDESIDISAIATDDTGNYEFENYSSPLRNPIYYFGNPFGSYFASTRFLIGKAFGFGFEYAYIPEVWGFQVTAGTLVRIGNDNRFSCSNLMLSAGADYRLSKPWSQFDFHLFGCVGINCLDRDKSAPRPTLEAGIRMASPDSLEGLCINSGSLSILTDFQTYYVTFGVSLALSTVAAAFLLLAL